MNPDASLTSIHEDGNFNLNIDEEFRAICREIRSQNLTIIRWRQIESDDMFQSKSYCGGFEACDDAFCFSYYDSTGQEFWFQLTLQEVEDGAANREIIIKARK